MSKSSLRSLYQGKKNVKNIFSLQGNTMKRFSATISATARYEVPELATAKPFEDIPKVPILPIIGSSWVFFPIIGRYKLNKLHEADRHKNQTYGDIVREKFGHYNFVNVFVPEAMEVISRHEGKYPTRGEFSTMKTYRESRPKWYKSTGVMILQGKEWHDLRSKTQRHLMKPKSIQMFLGPMQDVARDLVKRINQSRDSNKEVDGLLQYLYKWALESVTYVGLDTRLGCLEKNLASDSDGLKLINSIQTQFECMNKLETFAGNFPFWQYFPSPTWKKFTKACDDYTEMAFKYINRSLEDLQKRADEDSDLTMLQSMLLIKDLDVSEAVVMVADMLLAGVDTTSHTVGFLFYHLSKNPEKQKKLAEEIKQLLPNKTDRITTEVFNKLHYLKACLKEAMRLDPITRGNVRMLDHDVVICGYRIPAGTIIFCMMQQICRKEKYFKNADEFLPERWMNKENKPNFFSYVPFGIGVRSCIGRRLAELEMICLIAEVIRNFDIEYHHEDIDMYTRLVNIPDKPLRFSFLDR